MSNLSYSGIGLQGNAVGQCTLTANKIDWTGRSGSVTSFLKENISALAWCVFGKRAYLKLYMSDQSWTIMDGFAKDDYDEMSAFMQDSYNVPLKKEAMSGEGMNFGDMLLQEKTIVLQSVSDKKILELKLDNAAQAVVAGTSTNKDDLEIQFNENDADKEEDGLVQITFHFPPPEMDDEGNVDEQTPAQLFQAEILNTGVIKNSTGDVICEFPKEQGKFASPRGAYNIQMMPTFLVMTGAQYTYKIKYSDITSTFLLDKPDGVRMAFVICLDKPIRQGSQKYQHLVLDTHKMETSVTLNLTEEEIATNDSYKDNLQPTMTMACASLIAKIFKVLTETIVYVPKSFHSFRNDFCVRCNMKTFDGLLYPLAKQMIFINKPTIIIKYEELEYIEFQRYAVNQNSATKNFDMLFVLRKGQSAGKDAKYLFSSIDRTEYSGLLDFFESKKIKILNPQKEVEDSSRGRIAGAFAGMDMDDGGGEDESDDDSYDGGGNSEHSAGSDDSGSDEGASEDEGGEGGEEGGEKKEKKKRKKRESSGEPKEKTKRVKGEKREKGEKKKKDPNAPKNALSAYMFFMQDFRLKLKEEGTTLKVTEVATQGGAAWKAMSTEEKVPYDAKAAQDKVRYADAMVAYKAKNAVTGADLDSGDDIDMNMDVDINIDEE